MEKMTFDGSDTQLEAIVLAVAEFAENTGSTALKFTNLTAQTLKHGQAGFSLVPFGEASYSFESPDTVGAILNHFAQIGELNGYGDLFTVEAATDINGVKAIIEPMCVAEMN